MINPKSPSSTPEDEIGLMSQSRREGHPPSQSWFGSFGTLPPGVTSSLPDFGSPLFPHRDPSVSLPTVSVRGRALRTREKGRLPRAPSFTDTPGPVGLPRVDGESSTMTPSLDGSGTTGDPVCVLSPTDGRSDRAKDRQGRWESRDPGPTRLPP